LFISWFNGKVWFLIRILVGQTDTKGVFAPVAVVVERLVHERTQATTTTISIIHVTGCY